MPLQFDFVEKQDRPVVDVLAEAERRHLDAPLAVDKAVARGQVFVHKAVVGQVLHPVSHLGADGNLEKGESGSDTAAVRLLRTLIL